MEDYILVTGGLGFIGSNFVEFLWSKGHKNIIVVDNFSTGNLNNLPQEILSNIIFSNFSIQSPYLEKELALMQQHRNIKIKVIFHFAAWARVVRSFDDPIATFDNNVFGTASLLDIARNLEIPNFIYSSSSSIYGTQDTHVMTEDLKANPISPYAGQKYMGEVLCNTYSKSFRLSTVCLRYFNVYGRKQVTEGPYSLVIGKFLEAIRNNKDITIYGDGEQTRDYTNVYDICNGNYLAWKLLEKTEAPGYYGAYNLGSGEETSVNSLAKMLVDTYGKNYTGKIEHIVPNPRGHLEEKRKVANIDKSRIMLDWKPTIKLDKGITQLT